MSLRARLQQVAFTTGAEAFGVAVGALSGLLIVNLLPKALYAEYTFLVACQMLIIGLSDMGLGHCYLPVVGERSRETSWVIGCCRRVYEWRWRFLGAALLFVVPYWLFSSIRHAWLNTGYLLAGGSMLAAALLAMREQLGRTVLVILGEVAVVNRTGLAVNVLRLALVAGVLLWMPTQLSVAGLIAITAICSFAVVSRYRRLAILSDWKASGLTKDNRLAVDGNIKRMLLPLLLPALFYQFQGVITVFLASLLGTSTMIAEVGALTRLALLLTIVDRVTAMLLFPVISRAANGPALQTLIIKVHAVYLVAMGLLLASAIAFPQIWTLLLGKQYAAQQHLIWMAFLPSILMNGSGFAFTTLSSRGYTAKQLYAIPLILAVQALYLWSVGMSDTRSALGFSIASSAVYFIYQYALLGYRLAHLRRAPVAGPTVSASGRAN